MALSLSRLFELIVPHRGGSNFDAYKTLDSPTWEFLKVFLADFLAGGGTSLSEFRVRGVVTINVPDLTNFTLSGAGRDGITYVDGDFLLLAAQTDLTQNGPYQIVTVEGVPGLNRPTWWATGAVIPSGTNIEVGAEGTKYFGTTWAVLGGNTIIVDTNNPVLFPRVIKGTATLVNGTVNVGAAGGPPVLGTSPNIEVHLQSFINGNLTIRFDGEVAVTGPIGTGVINIVALKADGATNVADQSHVFWTLRNDGGA